MINNLEETMKKCQDSLNYLLTSAVSERDIIDTFLWIETALFRARIKLERELNQK